MTLPTYFYTAKSFDNETKTGSMNAQDERQLAQTLKSQGMVLIRAVLQEEKKKSLLNLSFDPFGISQTEKIMLTRNMEVMFSTGMPLVKTFDILAGQTKKEKLKKVLLDVKEKINKGENFSDALAGHPKIFSELFCNMIKVGEESGTLDQIFQILSLQLTKEHELKSRIKNAMIYPSIILMVMMVIGAIIITVVLPSLNIFFTALNVDIPIYTKMLLAAGNFLQHRWYVALLALILLAVAFIAAVRTKKGKWALDTALLKMPIVSPIIKKSNSAFLVRSLSSLIASGVSLVRALEISSKTVGNHYFKEALIEAQQRIKKGEKLSSSLKPYQNLFPLGVIEMMEVGEETGNTSSILKKLADFYEQEAASAIEKLTVIIEPVLIIFLGLAVGVFAFSIIQPMYSSLKSINT